MDSICKSFLSFFICLTISFAMEKEDSQTDQIQRDAKILISILNDHNGDAFAYDERYGDLGDSLINFAMKSKAAGQEYEINTVKKLYDIDKKSCQLNSFRITWLGLQLSMALTSIPNDQKKLFTAAQQYITVLEDIWLTDFADLEEREKDEHIPFFSEIKICHLFYQPLAVYTGNSYFSIRNSLAMTQNGIFLYCLNPSKGKGHKLHGGTFRNTNEKTIHDFIHYINQCINHRTWNNINFHDFLHGGDHPIDETLPHPSKERGISDVAIGKDAQKAIVIQKTCEARDTWKKMALTIGAILDNPDLLNSKEKSQLEITAFQIMHDDTFGAPFVLSSLSESPTLLDVAKKAAKISLDKMIKDLSKPDDEKQFYAKECEDRAYDHLGPKDGSWKSRKNIEITEIDETRYPDLYKVELSVEYTSVFDLPYEAKIFFTGGAHYHYWKAFHRDLAYSLIEKGLWSPENKILGTKYSMDDVRISLEGCYEWFLKALEPGEKLHEIFSKVKIA